MPTQSAPGDSVSLRDVLLQHLRSAGLDDHLLQQVDGVLQSEAEAPVASNLRKVFDCAERGQLEISAALLSGRTCSVLVQPWTTVAETKAYIIRELGIDLVCGAGYDLVDRDRVLELGDPIGAHVSPTSPSLTLVANNNHTFRELLRNCHPEVQKQMIGETLYPKVQQHQPDLAGRITGMMLELDNEELLIILSDDRLITQKVHEAMRILFD